MATTDDLFTARKSLDQICAVPDRIISVYSLEKHVWADSNSRQARAGRQPELQTIEEFQIGPVRPFLNDILRGMAAPYQPDRKDNPIGQGYWAQAEFGSGKSTPRWVSPMLPSRSWTATVYGASPCSPIGHSVNWKR